MLKGPSMIARFRQEVESAVRSGTARLDALEKMQVTRLRSPSTIAPASNIRIPSHAIAKRFPSAGAVILSQKARILRESSTKSANLTCIVLAKIEATPGTTKQQNPVNKTAVTRRFRERRVP